MKNIFKKIVKSSLNLLDLEIMKSSEVKIHMNYERELVDYISKLPKSKLLNLIEIVDKSKSQSKQDLFVLSELEFKRNGFFVEFGATNGIDLSNTFLLEKEFGWTGIVAEPAKCWHTDLYANRSCNIDTKCVWTDSDSVLNFKETNIAVLSTLTPFIKGDHLRKLRKDGHYYDVTSISLLDLLDKYNAPEIIDYLSIDTEGSEFEILKNFDFGKYKFNVITCEHNFTPVREKIFKLLSENGYLRKYSDLSKYDDWYVRSEQ